MSIPRMARACSSASSALRAPLTPPALPRPPVLTWALTTVTPPLAVPMRSAAARASSGVVATAPASTGTPCFSNTSRAWYSKRSTRRSVLTVGGVTDIGPQGSLTGWRGWVLPRAGPWDRSSPRAVDRVPPVRPGQRAYSGRSMAPFPRPAAVQPDEAPAPRGPSLAGHARGLLHGAAGLLDPSVLAG